MWRYDKSAIFILVGGGKDYMPSSNVESGATLKIIGRPVQEDFNLYIDSFEYYVGLGGPAIDTNTSATQLVNELGANAT